MKITAANPLSSFGRAAALSACLLLSLACDTETASAPPSAEVPDGPVAADVIGVYRGGTVTRPELERYVERANRLGRDLTASTEGDWREAAVRTIAQCEYLAEGETTVDRGSIEDEVLGRAMHRELGWDAIEVTPEEIRAEYEENAYRYQSSDQIRLQLIFRRTDDDPEGARAFLEDLRRQIEDGADFAEMAQRHSQSSTAESGGWMILRRDANVFAGFKEAAWALEMGQLSEILETPTGLFIIRPSTSQQGEVRPFEDVAEFVTQRARDAKEKRLRDAFVAAAHEHFDIKRYDERLTDPLLADDEALLEIDDVRFTAGDMVNQIDPRFLPGLYVGYLRHVHAFLDGTLAQAVLAREARRQGLDQRPEIIAEIDTLVDTAVCQQQREVRLADLVRQVDEETLRATYEQYRLRYTTARRRSFSVIFLPSTDDQPNWQVLQRAETMVDELRDGADFQTYVQRHSRHVSLANDGKIVDVLDAVAVRLLPMRSVARKHVDGLSIGEISDPVLAEVYDPPALRHHRMGVFIVRLDGLTPPRERPFEEVRPEVQANYLRRNYRQLDAELTNALNEEIGFRFVAENLPSGTAHP